MVQNTTKDARAAANLYALNGQRIKPAVFVNARACSARRTRQIQVCLAQKGTNKQNQCVP